MKKILFLLSVLICLVACQKPQEQSFIGTDIGSVPMNTTFNLHDFNGHIRTLEDFKGKVVVLFFGFTHCPDICPTTMIDLKKTMALLKDKASAVQVVFITLDPARDTEAVLKKFIPAFNDSFIGLTGSEADIDKVASQFKIFHKTVNDGSNAGYTIDHSADLYIINKDGKVKLHMSNEQKPEEMASDLAKLI